MLALALLMGQQLCNGKAMGLLLLFACAPGPHPCHSVKYIFHLSRLIDSLQKGKLILGQRNVKLPEEELNISEERGVKMATAVLDSLKI